MAAIASAVVVHAAGLGTLIAFGYGMPALPAPEAVIEVAMVLEPAPPGLSPAEPTPVAADTVPDPPVAEPATTLIATQPPDAIKDVAPLIPEVASNSAALLPPPVDAAMPPDPAPSMPQTPAPVPLPRSVRLPTRPPMQHAPRAASAAPRSVTVQQDSAATAALPTSTLNGAATPASASANQEAALEARIRDAVQAAVHYPPAARMMGVTGRARVQFDYRSGAVADPTLAQSSGTPMLDNAALAAARAAHYPPAPAPIEGRLLRLLVWVEFRPG